MHRILKDIAGTETDEIFRSDYQSHDQTDPSRSILAYLGSVHVDPLFQKWKMASQNEAIDSESMDQQSGRKVLGLKKMKSRQDISDERLNMAKMMYVYRENNEEAADD